MKKIILLVTLLFAFYAHARFSFDEHNVTSWLLKQPVEAISGEASACDAFADDVDVTPTAEGRRGRWEVEGGKREMCGYLKQSSALFIVLQASTNTEVDQVKVEPAGFPWMSAQVQYTQRTTIRARGIPITELVSDDTVVLVRTEKA